eukprot:CAMPEP_0117556238 /NCGR_PEP_ID=MMETSP0784-20121206/51700_1 /TAXON_ID=39447 /ORGANISM="" /LENGTH=222 /DNA_ID=CAMNT_0005353495 /DNA_START=227 /DNA_END=896 /DNA_ORIENTATION=-
MSVQAEVRCHDQVSLQAPLVHACVKILELLVRKLLLLLLLVLHGRLPREVHAPVTIEQVFEPLRFVELPADGTRRSKILKDNVQPQYHVANACPTVITVGRNRLVQRNASDASIQQQERGEEKAARHEQQAVVTLKVILGLVQYWYMTRRPTKRIARVTNKMMNSSKPHNQASAAAAHVLASSGTTWAIASKQNAVRRSSRLCHPATSEQSSSPNVQESGGT